MNTYEVLFKNGDKNSFESKLHIDTLNVIPTNGADMVFFYDVGVALNINNLKQIKIDGETYQMKKITF